VLQCVLACPMLTTAHEAWGYGWHAVAGTGRALLFYLGLLVLLHDEHTKRWSGWQACG